VQKTIIEPGRKARHYWRDLWRYRELLFILAWRNISVRYKQTALGVAWALLRAAFVMLAFLFFRQMAGLRTDGPPPPLLVLAAVLPWQFLTRRTV
jgi:lipopolysaccharide transport system permease protein